MITIEYWPEERRPDNTKAIKASFVRYNRKRVDPWFARYVQGQEPPKYQMPAVYDYLSTYRGYTLMLALHPANEIDPDREEWKLDPDYQ